MKWNYLFDERRLAEGRRLYEDGMVQSFRKDGQAYHATIKDDVNQMVTAIFQKGELHSIGCGCRYARSGHFCGHMAALLFRIDAETSGTKARAPRPDESIWKDAEISEGELRDMEEEFGREYHYFDFPAMVRNLHLKAALWRKAVSMAQSGEIVLSEVSLRHDEQGDSNTAIVTGYKKERNGYRFSIQILAGVQSVQRMSCEIWKCPDAYYEGMRPDKICVHEAALLWLFGRYILERNPGDMTNRAGNALLRSFRSVPREGTPEVSRLMQELTGRGAEEPLELVPYLSEEEDYSGNHTLYAGFRVGGRKKYKVKAIDEFLKAVSGGQVMQFGTKTQMSLRRERFDRSSERLLDLLYATADDVRRYGLLLGYEVPASKMKDRIPLMGDKLDRFFDLMQGKMLDISTRDGEKRSVVLKDGSLQAELELHSILDGRKRFAGVRLTGEVPDLIRGESYGYWITDTALLRTKAEDADRMRTLSDAARRGQVNLRIGRGKTAEFMYDILPVIRDIPGIQITEDEDIAAQLPPKGAFTFYLDTMGRNALCNPIVTYGNEHYDLLNLPADSRAASSAVPVPGRDVAREDAVLALLAMYFPELTPDGRYLMTGDDDTYLYLLLEEGVERLLAVGEVQSTDSFRRLTVRRKPAFSVGVGLESNLLNLEVTTQDFTPEELEEILTHYDRKKKFYRLKNGDFVNLEEESLELLEAMMQSLHLSPKEFVRGKMGIPAYRTLYLDKMLEGTEGIYAKRDSRFKALIKDFKTIADADFPVPKSMEKVLRPYQRVGYRWLRTLAAHGFGGILADEMGLGKTVQIIAMLEAAREERLEKGSETFLNGKPVDALALIVTPASLVFNWTEELARFAPELRVLSVTGTQAERALKIEGARKAVPDAGPEEGTAVAVPSRKGYDVLVTSYDLLKRDADLYEGLSFRYEIIDEGQFIKNHGTAAAKAVKLIAASCRFALTGTPIENRLSELWSIFDYLMPGLLYGYQEFRRSYEIPIVKDGDEELAARLGRMIAPFILRRFKKDVLKDLPDLLEEVRYSAMEPEQKRLYDAQVTHMREMLQGKTQEEFNRNRIQILAELTKIRQLCCDPSLYYADYRGGSAKREACLELVRSAIDEGHRLLVFSQFTSMLELLEKDLTEAGISYFVLTGSTPARERLGLVNRFNGGEGQVFLISTKAGGTGLNLTGADVVVHYDPWWNAAVEDQATGRAHRIGQKRTVIVYKLIIRGTIEDRIMELQQAKRKLAEDVLGDERMGSGVITREDLMELLQ